MAGMPTRVGSRRGRRRRPREDATVVARLRRAGAIVLGRTNTPEMLANYDTDNPITGRTNNPWDLERTPGGSSGGEAAAIAAYLLAGGIGSDGGGSIRMPAHFCGIAGLKPTPGRIPGAGHFPSLGHPGGTGDGSRTDGAHGEGSAAAVLRARRLRRAGPVLACRCRCASRQSAQCASACGSSSTRCRWTPEIRAGGGACGRHAGRRRASQWRPSSRAGMERAPNVWAFLFSQWPDQAGRDSPPKRPRSSLAARDRMRAALSAPDGGRAAILMPVFGITAFRHGESRFDGGRQGDRTLSGGDAGGDGERARPAGGDHPDGGFERRTAHRGAA